MVKKELLIIIVAAFCLRLLFLSPWLEDWDSVQFALALHNFSIVLHQPHPPGYPVYIFLARFLNLFTLNDTLTLTLLSALLGSIAILPLFILLLKMTNQRMALLGSLLLAVTPIEWALSEVALSNIPGLFFTTLTAYFLYQGRLSRKSILIGAFLGGITLGVRFAEWSIICSLLLLTLLCRKSKPDFVKSVLVFFVGILIWFIPLIIDTGWSQVVNSYTNQTSYIISHDSVISLNLLNRLPKIYELFIIGYSPYFIPLILLIMVYLFKSRTRLFQFDNLFVIVWLLSYLIPLILIYNLEVPRHLLPLLPPLILLLTLSMERIKKYQAISTLFICIIMVLMFTVSINQAKQIRNLIPPTVAPVLYVKENFQPEKTLIISDFTYRQFQYYAPGFKNFYGSKNAPIQINTEYVILDLFSTKEQIAQLADYNISDVKEFSGPVDIFPRISKTRLYILKRS